MLNIINNKITLTLYEIIYPISHTHNLNIGARYKLWSIFFEEEKINKYIPLQICIQKCYLSSYCRTILRKKIPGIKVHRGISPYLIFVYLTRVWHDMTPSKTLYETRHATKNAKHKKKKMFPTHRNGFQQFHRIIQNDEGH